MSRHYEYTGKSGPLCCSLGYSTTWNGAWSCLGESCLLVLKHRQSLSGGIVARCQRNLRTMRRCSTLSQRIVDGDDWSFPKTAAIFKLL